MKMALEVNTRKYKRYATKIKVKLNSGRLSFWGITNDISEKGLRIRANQEFPVNKILDLELIMPDGGISFLSGVVRYVSETPHSGKRYGIGIEIIYDDSTFKNYLKDLEEKAVTKSEIIVKSACNLSQNKEDVSESNVYILSPSIVARPLSSAITEHMQKADKNDQADINSQECDVTQPSNQIMDESCEQIGEKEKEQEFIEIASSISNRAIPVESTLYKGKVNKMTFVSIFLIILAIGIATSGILLYGNLKQDPKIQQVSLICCIQIGAFQSQANAQILLETYKQKGHKVYIEKSDIKDKGVMYKVLIGPFKNLENTSHLAMDIREKENVNAFVICK